jgi:hypothetical protein
MSQLVVFLASLGLAWACRRLAGGRSFRLADVAIGIVSGLVGLSVASYLNVGGAAWSLGLPLLIACGLTLGLSQSSADAPRA